MEDFIDGVFCFVFIVGIIWGIAFMNNPDGTKALTKKILQKINQNTSKVRDYAIIVVCIAAIIALIAFFAR